MTVLFSGLQCENPEQKAQIIFEENDARLLLAWATGEIGDSMPHKLELLSQNRSLLPHCGAASLLVKALA